LRAAASHLTTSGLRYLGWWRQGAFDTGPTVGADLRLVNAGFSFDDAATHVNARTRGLTAVTQIPSGLPL